MEEDLGSEKALVADVDGEDLFGDGVDTLVALHPLAGVLVVLGKLLGNVGTHVAELLLYTEREMFYLTMYSTHFIYGYMVSDIRLRTVLIVRKEIRCRHIGYSYRFFYMHNPADRITHTAAFVTPGWNDLYTEGMITFYCELSNMGGLNILQISSKVC